MLAILALIAFVIGIVENANFGAWPFWALLGLAFIAADMVFTGLGYTYPWHRRS